MAKKPLVSSGRKTKLIKTGMVLEKDLRFGKYMGIPPKKFAGNIFSLGDSFYKVQNNGSMKKIEGTPGINNEAFLEFA